jgi:hypothetical protein
MKDLDTVVDLPGGCLVLSALILVFYLDTDCGLFLHCSEYNLGVELFQRVGTLESGLPEWASLRGSSRDENFHSLINSIASKRLGPQLDSCLIMHLVHRFNFRGGVLFKGWPDCGHDDTW